MLIAESYGGRDEPVDALVGNFVDVGLAPPFDALRVKGTPTEQTYQEYEESGTDLAQLLTQKVLQSYNSPTEMAGCIHLFEQASAAASCALGCQKRGTRRVPDAV